MDNTQYTNIANSKLNYSADCSVHRQDLHQLLFMYEWLLGPAEACDKISW